MFSRLYTRRSLNMKPKFKSGDRVVCDNEAGIVYSISRDFRDKFSYLINLETGRSFWVDEYKLKLIKRKKEERIIIKTDGALVSLVVEENGTVIENNSKISGEFLPTALRLLQDVIHAKAYSGKAICLQTYGGFTKGKEYDFEYGTVKDDQGFIHGEGVPYTLESFEPGGRLNNRFYYLQPIY